jgi:thiol-disulfide isomerase/thioredoxin
MAALKLVALVGGLALAANCGGGAAKSPPSAPHPLLDARVGFMAPSDTGELVNVPPPGAQATIVDFWATSCAPCAQAVPALEHALAADPSPGVELVLVGVLEAGESTAEARQTLRGWGAQRGFVVDRDGGVQRQLAVQELPATLVLDAQGQLAWVAPANSQPTEVVAAARAVAGR